MSCEQCGGVLALLGTLGRLTWFRCVQCGWQQSCEDFEHEEEEETWVRKV